MKKLTCQILTASAILFCLVSAKAATVTVTVSDDAIPANDGANGTFYWALTNAQAGDTIAFNIDSGTYGPGPYFLQVPTNGFPLIYNKHGLTIDGYTQPGALANTNPITGSNSAQLKIVIDGRNGNGRDINFCNFDGTLAKSDPPIDNTLMAGNNAFSKTFALLAVYRSTNVTIKGLAFLADNLAGYVETGKGAIICLEFLHDYGLDTSVKDALEYGAGSDRNCHVAGCWFGVNPTNVTKSGVVLSAECISFPRYRYEPCAEGSCPDPYARPEVPNVGLTIGVAAGSANPRAEFNVMAGSGFAFTGEPIRTRISGNFIWFLPDGVTPFDFSTYNPLTHGLWISLSALIVEMGRYGEVYASSSVDAKPMVIGTDGDGVNDADEGNLWGPIGGAIKFADNSGQGNLAGLPSVMNLYHSGDKVWLIAGNRWGINNNGTQFTNCANFISGTRMVDETPYGNTRFFFGSDFASGRSAATIAAQANQFYNNWPIGIYGNPVSLPAGKVVPSFHMEHPHDAEVGSTNACLSIRGNVLVGMGPSPFNYTTNGSPDSLPLLRQFTNFFSAYLDTNAAIIPVLNAGSSVYPNLVGTFSPGVGYFSNVTIDVYERDPYGWTNGQKFVFEALTDHATYTNGFPQGKRYLGSSAVANSGSFNISLGPPMLALSSPDLTVTANYSVSPAGTAWAKTTTSDFSTPITVRPLITATKSGSNLNVSWEPAGVMYTVQTNASVVSAGTWGNHTAGPVAPPVSVPIGAGTKFFRLKP